MSIRQRNCRACGEPFECGQQRVDANRQHCSHECSVASARKCRTAFWKRQPDRKTKMAAYYQKSREKLGPDSNLKRFYARYPEAPKCCESCGENRVLDVAHKPGHERRGAWRSVKNTTIEKVWILCPTCHALLDRMAYPPADLGLREVTNA